FDTISVTGTACSTGAVTVVAIAACSVGGSIALGDILMAFGCDATIVFGASSHSMSLFVFSTTDDPSTAFVAVKLSVTGFVFSATFSAAFSEAILTSPVLLEREGVR